MSHPADLLDPATPPGGVKRLSKVPLVLIIGVLTVVLALLVWVGSKRSDAQSARESAVDAQGKQARGSAASAVGDVLGDLGSGMMPADAPATVKADPKPESSVDAGQPSLPVARGDDLPPPPPSRSAPNSFDPAIERQREQQLEAFRKAALADASKTVKRPAATVGGARSGSAAASGSADNRAAALAAARQRLSEASSNDPAQAFSARLAALQAAASGAAAAAGGSAAPGSEADVRERALANRARHSDISQFDDTTSGARDRWSLDTQRRGPKTPFTLTAGASVIPARLAQGINSELPGPIRAIVTRNVYDTATGRHLLIPQGTQILGSYSNQVVYGQSAVLAAYQRLVFPDGSTMDLGSMPGADAAGYAGFRDVVDNHYWRIFGSAFLMSGIVAGVAMSQPESNSGNGRTSARDALSEAVGQQLGQASAQMISKNLNIAPTIQIRPGYTINVIPTKDLSFTTPYRAFDY